MTPQLALGNTDFESRAVSPLRELGAYEALWEEPSASFKTLSEKFAAHPGAVPSDFVPSAKRRNRPLRPGEISRRGGDAFWRPCPRRRRLSGAVA